MTHSFHEETAEVAIVPNSGATVVVGSVPVFAPGCWQVFAEFKFTDNLSGQVGAISFRLTVHGGAPPVQVGGTENPSPLHTDIPNPPSSSLVVNPGLRTVDAQVNNPVTGNAGGVRVSVRFEAKFLSGPGVAP
jgi:hypothetical protein